MDKKAPRQLSESTVLLSIEDVCEVTTCGQTTIYAAIRNGALRARKIGRRTVVAKCDLFAWLATLPIAPRSEPSTRAAAPG